MDLAPGAIQDVRTIHSQPLLRFIIGYHRVRGTHRHLPCVQTLKKNGCRSTEATALFECARTLSSACLRARRCYNADHVRSGRNGTERISGGVRDWTNQVVGRGRGGRYTHDTLLFSALSHPLLASCFSVTPKYSPCLGFPSPNTMVLLIASPLGLYDR